MKSLIIRIAAALTGALLVAGCAARLDPALEDGSIHFSAESLLLRDDMDTKAGTPKTAFTNGDFFYVYGCHNTITSPMLFDGTQVNYDGSKWTYNPIKSWEWSGNSDYYNFLAITGPATAGDISLEATNPLKVTLTDYTATSTQYDLMGACVHRDDSSTDIVHMNFRHLLSSVSVSVTNDSDNESIKLYSVGFANLCTKGTVTVTQNDNDVTDSWIASGRDENTVLGYTPDPQPQELAAAASYPTSEILDLMVPQVLNGAVKPSLVLDYSYYDNDQAADVRIVTKIRLEDIKIKGSSDYITSWESGTKYTYDIHIRLGGGVRVNVITTQWDEVNAETPGLII